MSSTTLQSLARLHRADGSAWAECELLNSRGVVAIVPGDGGSHSATCIFELRSDKPFESLEAAQAAVDAWLTKLSAE